MDYYCGKCHKEMYALAVSAILEQGGTCPWCSETLEAGEALLWTTLEREQLLSCNMSTQHISSILHTLYREELGSTNETVCLLETELKERNEERRGYNEA